MLSMKVHFPSQFPRVSQVFKSEKRLIDKYYAMYACFSFIQVLLTHVEFCTTPDNHVIPELQR